MRGVSQHSSAAPQQPCPDGAAVGRRQGPGGPQGRMTSPTWRTAPCPRAGRPARAPPPRSSRARRSRSPLPRLRCGREDRGDHAAPAVHHRPAGVARPHQAAQGGDPALDRAAPVGVLADHRARPAEARRLDVVGRRSPGSRARPPTCRAGAPSSASAGDARDPGRRAARQVVARVEPDRLGVVARALAPQLDGGVVLARHHVRVGDHHAVAGDPARALHAEPARRAQHPHHAAARRAHLGVARDGRVRAPTPRGRAVDAWGTGRTAPARWSSGPDGGSAAFSSGGSPSAGSARAARVRRACGAPPRPRSRPVRAPGTPPAAAPPSPSSTPRLSPRRWRRRKPSTSRLDARMPPSSSAPTSANSGA